MTILPAQFLEQSSESFRRALDAAQSNGVAAIDAEGRQVMVSDGFCRMVGWTREELVGLLPPFPYWPCEERESLRELMDLALSGNFPPTGASAVLQHRDGSRFPALLHLTPVVEHQVITGWVVNVTDLSEQGRQQDALKASEQMFRDMAEHIEEVFYIFDPAAERMLYVSPSYERVWGRTCESLYAVPTSFLDAIVPEQRERQRLALEAQAAGRITREEYLIRRPDGREAWIWDQSFPIRDRDGNVQRIVGLAADITARKLAEESIAQHERRLALALEAAQLGFWDVDLTRGVTVYDDAWAEMLGFTLPELREGYNGWWDRLHPEDVPQAQSALEKLVADPDSLYEVEVRMRHRNGEWRWILSRGRIVERDASGVPTRIVGTHQDVTERRKVEAMMRQSERLDSLGSLTGGIAHNFNNLLAVIVGTLERAIAHPGADPAVRKILATALDAADSGSSLTASLLTLARRRPPTLAVEEINGRLRELLPLLTASLPPTIRISCVPAAENLPVLLDRGQFDSAIVNLVVNARDAMPDGGEIRISTRTERFDESTPASIRKGLAQGVHVLVEVSDSGGGMDERTLTHAFDPYFTTKGSTNGTGLGLSTVYGFCRSVGGIAAIESAEGAGTKVSLLFPLAGEPGTGTPDEPPAAPAPPAARRGRILVVEDNPVLRTLACNILEQSGHDVHAVESVPEAIAHLGGNGCDLVFSDVMFEGGPSGLELAAWMKANRPDLTILLTSGVPLEPSPASAGLRFLQKPYRVAEVLSAVASVLAPPKA